MTALPGIPTPATLRATYELSLPASSAHGTDPGPSPQMCLSPQAEPAESGFSSLSVRQTRMENPDLATYWLCGLKQAT